MDKPLIKFDYVNWKGENHVYVVLPKGIEYGKYAEEGVRRGGSRSWVLHGDVITRDGDSRSHARGPGGALRRTFLLRGIRNLRDLSREDS